MVGIEVVMEVRGYLVVRAVDVLVGVRVDEGTIVELVLVSVVELCAVTLVIELVGTPRISLE